MTNEMEFSLDKIRPELDALTNRYDYMGEIIALSFIAYPKASFPQRR
jgi:hypothetical protein